MHHTHEKRIAREYDKQFKKHLGTPAFFPEDSLFDDLPLEAINLYRQWVVNLASQRVSHLSFPAPTITVPGVSAQSKMNPNLTIGQSKQRQTSPGKLDSDQSRLELSRYRSKSNAMGAEISQSWASATSRAVRSVDREISDAAHLPVRMFNMGVGDTVMLFPDSLYSYALLLDDSSVLARLPDASADMEMHVKIDTIQDE